MKIITILLYLAIAAVVVFAVLDITSQADFTKRDKEAVRFAAKQMDAQITELGFTKTRQYNYLNAQIKACQNQDGFSQFAKQLKLVRAIAFNAIDNSKWLENAMADKSGMLSLPDSSLERLEYNYESFAQNLSTVNSIEQKTYATPIPYKSEFLDDSVSLKSLQGSDAMFWQLAKNNIETFVFEVENKVLADMISQIDCGESTKGNIQVTFASESGTIEPGEDYKANMYLTGNYFAHDILVTSTDGEVTYDPDTQKATLIINTNEEDLVFDDNGEAVQTWTAKLKVPSMNGYEEFEIKREFIVRR